MSSALRTTLTRSSVLFWLDVGFIAALAGAADDAGFAPGIVAGFTAGAGAPGAGLAACAGTPAAPSAALVSLVFICCSDFAMLRALSMASGFCQIGRASCRERV